MTDPFADAPHLLPVPALPYSVPRRTTRPGLITAIGVISIVVAALTMLGSLTMGGYGFLFMAVSRLSANRATPTRATGTTPAFVGVAPGSTQRGAAPVSTGGLPRADRAKVVEILSEIRALPRRRDAHLDALLRVHGQALFPPADGALSSRRIRTGVLSHGSNPGNYTGGQADYFVLSTGMLEVSDLMAKFQPNDGTGPWVAAAPPQDANTSDAAAPDDPPAAAVEDDESPSTAPAQAGAPKAGEINAYLAQAQGAANNRLNAAQLSTLKTLLSAPGQQIVQTGPGTLPGGSMFSAYVGPDGNAVVIHSNGRLTLSPQGQVIAQSNFAAGGWGGAGGPGAAFSKIREAACVLVIAEAFVSFLLAIYLLVSGIMVLRQSPRGARMHRIYAWLKIPLAFLGAAAGAWMWSTFMMGMAGANGTSANLNAVWIIWAIAFAMVACIYPVALLITLRTRGVRDYYNSAGVA